MKDAASAMSDLLPLEERLFGTSLQALKEAVSYDERLTRCWRLIELRYADAEFDLDTASSQSGMSKNNLNLLLRSVTGGLTFYRLLSAYRIYQSLLDVTQFNHTFTEAALAHGFDNSSSYSRAVKRLLQCPPKRLLPRGPRYRRELCLPQSLGKKDAVETVAKALENSY